LYRLYVSAYKPYGNKVIAAAVKGKEGKKGVKREIIIMA
jgi:hypothetical protein